MRLALLPALLLAAVCAAKEGDIHCHDHDDSREGKACEFKDIYKEMNFYCETYRTPRLVPIKKLDPMPWGYSKHLGGLATTCPWFGPNCVWNPAIFMGWVRFDSSYGNISGKDDPWNVVSYLRCMEYMGNIERQCGGHGGSYETGYGEVFAYCIAV